VGAEKKSFKVQGSKFKAFPDLTLNIELLNLESCKELPESNENVTAQRHRRYDEFPEGDSGKLRFAAQRRSGRKSFAAII